MIENYFWAKNLEQYIIKGRKLTNSQRINIVNTLVDFLFETFGVNPSAVQKAITAAAAIVLFPGLEFKDGESTVCSKSTSCVSYLHDFIVSFYVTGSLIGGKRMVDAPFKLHKSV